VVWCRDCSLHLDELVLVFEVGDDDEWTIIGLSHEFYPDQFTFSRPTPVTDLSKCKIKAGRQIIYFY